MLRNYFLTTSFDENVILLFKKIIFGQFFFTIIHLIAFNLTYLKIYKLLLSLIK